MLFPLHDAQARIRAAITQETTFLTTEYPLLASCVKSVRKKCGADPRSPASPKRQARASTIRLALAWRFGLAGQTESLPGDKGTCRPWHDYPSSGPPAGQVFSWHKKPNHWGPVF